MQVKFVDLSRQYEELRTEILDAVDEVYKSGWYVLGPKLEQFEHEFAEYCEVKHAIGVGNGSDALYLILAALKVKSGDEVITAPNSFVASAAAIARTGATPVFCDVGADMNLDPELLEGSITERTKAIMPVHLTGRIAKIEEINEIASRHNIPVIEDAAQAVGALRNGKRAGSFGLAAGFSLHPLKNLFVHGDGGVITTNSDHLMEQINILRNHGLKNRDEASAWGINSRLDEVQAAGLLIKLKHIDRWNEIHRSNAALYTEMLDDSVQTPVHSHDEFPIYHRYMISTNHRCKLAEYLNKKGVETRVNYPKPLHLHEAASTYGYKNGDFIRCEELCSKILSLPMYSHLNTDEIEYVSNQVNSFFKS